jgi:hypothetical protein
VIALRDVDPKASERHRLELLHAADDVLGEIELLRLRGRSHLPEQVRRALLALQLRTGRAEPAVPATIRAAQNLVFGLQQRLMAANPRRPSARAHPGRAGGMPAITPIRPGIEWKLLVLPPHPGPGRDQWWLTQIDLTVERALDRWAYAHHHARRAVKGRRNVPAALAVMRVAWNNYWELMREAGRIQASIRATTGAPVHRPAR